MVCHADIVHDFVGEGSKPVWGRPVHEALAEVDAVCGEVCGADISAVRTLTLELDLRVDRPDIHLVRVAIFEALGGTKRRWCESHGGGGERARICIDAGGCTVYTDCDRALC